MCGVKIQWDGGALEVPSFNTTVGKGYSVSPALLQRDVHTRVSALLEELLQQ